ncbi:MAG: oxygen-dependent coproporphyrinogen oxidase [Schleiferiaceae bacterium]|nr:oxygen-dependent coproporphyrinogen oxidase [Schleiferiaceae bacterium]
MSKQKEQFTTFIHELQDRICAALEKVDGGGKFVEDAWERPGGGGGKTRILRNGTVIEKGGVNTSVVYGELPQLMQERLNASEAQFFACGISLVIHPKNPMVPTVHANFRFFELYDENGDVKDAWFGGGADLTPYYLFEEDAVHFHQTLKSACDPFGEELYPNYKKECDTYFRNTHRDESRGIGGVFFDYLKADEQHTLDDWMAFTTAVGDSFIQAYCPIVARRKALPYNQRALDWQGIRRGRYVEFNLIHDRGTLFGLKTNGRIESILMSLPATASWEYNHHPEEGSPEAQLLEVLVTPRDWV